MVRQFHVTWANLPDKVTTTTSEPDRIRQNQGPLKDFEAYHHFNTQPLPQSFIPHTFTTFITSSSRHQKSIIKTYYHLIFAMRLSPLAISGLVGLVGLANALSVPADTSPVNPNDFGLKPAAPKSCGQNGDPCTGWIYKICCTGLSCANDNHCHFTEKRSAPQIAEIEVVEKPSTANKRCADGEACAIDKPVHHHSGSSQVSSRDNIPATTPKLSGILAEGSCAGIGEGCDFSRPCCPGGSCVLSGRCGANHKREVVEIVAKTSTANVPEPAAQADCQPIGNGCDWAHPCCPGSGCNRDGHCGPNPPNGKFEIAQVSSHDDTPATAPKAPVVLAAQSTTCQNIGDGCDFANPCCPGGSCIDSGRCGASPNRRFETVIVSSRTNTAATTQKTPDILAADSGATCGWLDAPCKTNSDCCQAGRGNQCLSSGYCAKNPPFFGHQYCGEVADSCTEKQPCCEGLGIQCGSDGICYSAKSDSLPNKIVAKAIEYVKAAVPVNNPAVTPKVLDTENADICCQTKGPGWTGP
ncbi:hypothetical protein BT63DRAFT_150299 [Microthyrium microscopicum]|uniref:Uncharacterized protein n=1 Tax=Microthyrium microscopicum TaxID=703497 RepID=A0A6A6UQ61_9PEZI|nr:hypothetical protein BT63DRAFT_150299 [Microthyrium microscopicum]